MRKKIFISNVFFGVLILVCSTTTMAVDKTFLVSASVPAATSVAISAFSVKGTPPVFTSLGTGTNLSFDPMTFITTNNANIYLPDHFFAIDVVAQGGAGSPSATLTFSQTTNPNAPAHGLGWKATATFTKVTFKGPLPTDTTEAPMSAHGPKKLLKDVNGESITTAETAGGWLRVYVGVVTLDTTQTIPDPTGAEVFSNADKPGSYEGTLLISATVA